MTTGSIALDVCRELHITPEELLGGCRRADVVRARRIAILRFKAAGFNNTATARMLKLHLDTVRYWVNPSMRARKLAKIDKKRQAKEAIAAKQFAMIEELQAALS